MNRPPRHVDATVDRQPIGLSAIAGLLYTVASPAAALLVLAINGER